MKKLVLSRLLERMGSLSILLCSLLALTGCEEETKLGKSLAEDAFRVDEEEREPVPPPAVPVGPSCYSERWVQPEAEITRNIDILFVTDTSGSINRERGDIAEGIESFVAQLPEEVSYQIGVLLAHSPNSINHARLYQNGNEPLVLNSDEMDLVQVREDLEEKLTSPPNEQESDGGEMGLFAIYHALQDGPVAEMKSQGFFREDAALAVVFISDENAICAEYPEGVTPKPDTEFWDRRNGITNEEHASGFCGGINQDSVYDEIHTFQGDKPLLLAGIIYTDEENVPTLGEDEVGYGYKELVEKDEGALVDIKSGELDEGLADIGTLATTKLTLKKEFNLSEGGEYRVDSETIEVFVDGNRVGHRYFPDLRDVRLDEAGGALSVVDINYCMVTRESEAQ
jgi:hypothetical protein